MLKRINALLLCGCAAIMCAAHADTLKLKDGTSLHGKVMDQGANYWVKPDGGGDSRTILKTDVDSWEKDAPAATVAPAAAAGGSFGLTKTKANHTDSPIAAVGMWQAYIDANPTATDLPAAKEELKYWKTLADGNAIKINGKWVGGDELKKLMTQVRTLLAEGEAALRNDQTLLGISKYEDVLKIYPDSFEANYELGFFYLVKGMNTGKNLAQIDKGIKSLETAVKLQPKSAATLSNLAIAYNFRQKYKLSVTCAYEASKIEDSKDIVQNLLNALYYAPEGMRKNDPAIRLIAQEALILGEKYGLAFGSEMRWMYVRPQQRKLVKGKEEEDESKGPPGIFGVGSGFFIASDGYILTNRHVAKPGDYLVVRLSDGTEKLAERVIIDDEQDLAIIRIKTDQPVPFVPIAPYDHPPTGADVAVFGFPMQGANFSLTSGVKMTRGIITAWDEHQEYCDVTVDAQVNPGNSGGPMIDKHGNLLAITAMKTLSNTMVSSYGLGISSGRIEKFLTKQKDKLGDVHSLIGKDTGFAMNNERLATQITPATVCIFMCRGEAPASTGPIHVKPAGAPDDAAKP